MTRDSEERRQYLKAYLKEYLPKYRKQRKGEAIIRLGGKCVRCGVTENLDFDHIDRTTKILPMGRLWTRSNEEIEVELTKCQLLCKPCHKEKSIECGDLRRATHGSSTMYKNHKCRCQLCVSENNRRSREYRFNKRQAAGARSYKRKTTV